jgi:hypothetical protein
MNSAKYILENGLLQFLFPNMLPMKKIFHNIGSAFGYEIGFAIKTVAQFVNFVMFPFPRNGV